MVKVDLGWCMGVDYFVIKRLLDQVLWGGCNRVTENCPRRYVAVLVPPSVNLRTELVATKQSKVRAFGVEGREMGLLRDREEKATN